MQINSIGLIVTSPAFRDGDAIPPRHSPRGEDLSPALTIENIAAAARFLAITFDDTSHPLFGVYNHWVIWNIPVRGAIPEGIPPGKSLHSLGGALQGIAYGRHRYKGPKPPFHCRHNYLFTVYATDSIIDLPAGATKRDLLARMEGHVLQRGALAGTFQSL